MVAAQIAIALARSPAGKTFTRIDNVDGMMNAAPTPMSARHPMICHISVACDAAAAPHEERREPELERALPPEAVAERAGGEQQTREHEGVRRDDPLEL